MNIQHQPLLKAHVRAHTRKTKSGTVAQVRDYDNKARSRSGARKTIEDHHAAVLKIAAEEGIAPLVAASLMQSAAATLGDEHTVGLLGIVKRRIMKQPGQKTGGVTISVERQSWHGIGLAHVFDHDNPGPNGKAKASIPVNTKEELQALKKKYGATKVEFQKSHVRAHTRRTKSGKVAQVKEHEDSRAKKIVEADDQWTPSETSKDHAFRFGTQRGIKRLFRKETNKAYFGGYRIVSVAHPSRYSAEWINDHFTK